MNAIECDSLVKVYSHGFRPIVRALDGVSLEVGEGEIFGLLGPNGAGKTTLIKILLGLVRPGSGNARILGAGLGDSRVRARVGYLPEQPRYPEYLTGRKMLEIFGRLGGLPTDLARQRAARLLGTVKLEKWQDNPVKTYSKGMAQRLGLAQALLGDPDLVILDEPTDGVDPIGRYEIREVLLGLRKAGKTVLLNSHLLSEIETVCDRVAVMDRGRLVARGRMEELVARANRYRIRCSGIGPELQGAIAVLCLSKNLEDGNLEVTVEDTRQLNRIIDLLRGKGVLIESVTEIRESLESYFVKLIKDIRGLEEER
jgi:ABC-2 type transport system ATP-binding protein